MRAKSNQIDYRYFYEPNISPMNIERLIANIHDNSLIFPNNIATDLSKQEINQSIIEQLLENYSLYKIFNYVYEQTKDYEATIT
jgi:Asp-tRNA(Asn)/Glu-tRNA(Gln) amidotransferase B subunit